MFIIIVSFVFPPIFATLRESAVDLLRLSVAPRGKHVLTGKVQAEYPPKVSTFTQKPQLVVLLPPSITTSCEK